jgi:alpha-1,3-rhamnosyl/mannosyltransferase
MRVLVNGLAMIGARTGVGHYTGELVRCLRPSVTVECFPTGWLRAAGAAWSRLRTRLDYQAPQYSPLPGPLAGTDWRGHLKGTLRSMGTSVAAHRFQALARRGCFDLYHEPNFIPLPCDLPTVVTVHDLSAILHPEWQPADRVAAHERHFRARLGPCAHVLTDTDSVRRELIRTLNIAPGRITRAYLGVRRGLGPLPETTVRAVLKRLRLPPRFLLYLGTLEPRKNVLTLLRAYCDLPGQIRDRYPLLLVGGWGWNAGELAAYLQDTARHRGVLHLGYLADEDLAAVYNGARALAFPSFYEGFGLPPVEMLACGGAVLASTAEAVIETVGRQAVLIDPHDLAGWRAALARVLTDDDWWQSLRRGATAAAQPFTWERCAADSLAVYRRVLARQQNVDRIRKVG